MKDFDDFVSKNGITQENASRIDCGLLKKAFLAGMKSQKSRILRLSNAKKELKSLLDGCSSRIEQMNLLLSAMEEEQEK